jgi:hypothetical protein
VPKQLRVFKRLMPGTEIEIVDHPEGVLIRARPGEPDGQRPTLDDLYGFLRCAGPPVSVEDMNRAINNVMRAKWEKLRRPADPT